MAKLIEKVYGDALFELAKEENKLNELLEQAQAVKQVLSDNPDFNKLLLNPAISKDEKQRILLNVWEGRTDKELIQTMQLLMQKEHYKQLPLVLDYFIARVKEEKKIGIAYVKTAMPLPEAQKKAVEERLLATTGYASFEMHYEADASLIGGMVIRIGDRVLDNSIRTKLDNLSRQLYQIKLQ